jgi:hypothetical protein
MMLVVLISVVLISAVLISALSPLQAMTTMMYTTRTPSRSRSPV